MSRFTKSNKGANTTVNHEGAVAYNVGDEMALYSLVCTFAMQDKFYESASEQMTRLTDLIKKVNPIFVARLAVYAREKMYLRTVPVILAVELAKIHKGDNLVARMVKRIIQRVDEITEVLSYYQMANGRTGTKKLGKVSNQIKQGIKDVFESGKFGEYHFSKYNRKTDVRFRDAIFLTHPKPQSDEMKALFDKIITDTLAVADTWENRLSEAGKADSPATTKKAVWESLIDENRIGYMAMLRNLRNIIQVEVSQSHMDKVCAYISNPEAVRTSKQFPFRFLSAYRMLVGSPSRGRWGMDSTTTPQDLNQRYVNQVVEALEKAMVVSAEQVPSFANSVFATDVSGSMQHPVSEKSVVQCFDIGTVLCMMSYLHSKGSVTGMFGDSFKVVNFPKENILRNANEIHKREGEVGYSTNGYKVLDWALKQKEDYDNFFFFTDCQMWSTDARYRGRMDNDLTSKWSQYKKRNPNAKAYFFDLNGHGTTPIQMNEHDVFMISGWSDKVFGILKRLSEGGNALDEINQIEL